MSNSEAADRTEALRVLHVAIDPPVGARLRSRLHAVRPAHGDWDIEALISAMSGESSSGHDLDRLLLYAQRRDPGIADELQVVHLARIINLGFEGSSRRSVHARAALIEAFGQPTPMELAAVADADGRPSAELPVVLGVLADESASLWSEADVRAYVHFRHDDLIECGLTGTIIDRAVARGLLGSDIASDLVPYLTAGAAAARQAAAEWMRSLRDASVEPALRVAIAREKLDLVKQAQMAAIESLGGSLEEYLNPQRLLADATKAMKKGLPPAIDWLDLARLPELRWADGSPVDPVIIQWFIVSAVKSKTAEPSPLLRRHFARMVESDVEELAQWLLDRWITQDLAGIPPARTASEATSARFLAMAEGTLGSALPSKGLLAVVAAGGGAPIVAPSVAYIDMWRGNRTSQCKSLIQMLAWIDHPLAAQAVLSISTRFRTKTIQAEAALQTELLAERKQWTLDELGDRTIPTSGFDHDGRLVLSYGQRTFTAQLTDDLKVVLVNDQTGSSIKALPEPRVDEDDEVVRRAKADLATARKEIKQAASSQPSRLARAMCMQRAWTLEDFRRDILGHPVMRRVASRLVWTAETETETLTFRPLTDATLLDVEDQTVGLCDDAVIRVAHDLTVSPGDGQRWLAHLRDYEVSPLITQFGRPPVPEQLGDVIDDFNGHLIGTFKLKRMMTKLGWGAGGSAGGGVIDSIVRQFPGSDFEAILDIAGMPAYAEDWTTALRLLYFIRVGQRPVAGNAAPIASLPPVLVAEIYNDVASIAAAGTGFDPEWEVSGALGKR